MKQVATTDMGTGRLKDRTKLEFVGKVNGAMRKLAVTVVSLSTFWLSFSSANAQLVLSPTVEARER